MSDEQKVISGTLTDEKLYFDRIATSAIYDMQFGCRKWAQKVPYIKFPAHWYVQIAPPYLGALVRFYASYSVDGDNISVYLDVYGMLGGVDGEPYWEAYPIEGETMRFDMNDTEGLIAAIDNELYRLNK